MGLEVYLGPCTDMRNHFCSSESPELSGLGHRFAIGVTEEETGREQIARARYVNDFVHGIGRIFAASLKASLASGLSHR